MRVHRLITLFSISALILGVVRTSPAQERVTPEQVDQSIKKAIEYFIKTQKADGSWEETAAPVPFHGGATQWGGRTALAAYSMLAAGQSHQSPAMKKAVQWLKEQSEKKTMNLTYSIGMRANVWLFVPMDASVKKALVADREMLLTHAQKSPRGFYSYECGSGGESDTSNSQYGVLGLWALEQLGGEIPTDVWTKIDNAWRGTQGADGGWQYGLSVPTAAAGATPQMTAAGIATLFITQDYIRGKEGVDCRGNIDNPNISAGLGWMGKNYDPNWADLYLLYGVERIGVASGYKYFGTHDWYQSSAATLVRSQGGDGSWGGGHGGPVCSTAWGLIFLSRGRAPVVMNKLEYEVVNEKAARRAARKAPKGKDAAPGAVAIVSAPGPWNQRSRDVANATKFIAKQIERELNWQIVNLGVSVDDLHDSQLLYISGDNELNFKDTDLAKLRAFVDGGGILVGNADCGKGAFVSGFKDLGKRLFPQYEFSPLKPEHPILSNQQFKFNKGGKKVEVLGLSNGSRELMLLLPSDPAKSWQQNQVSARAEHFQMIANIFLYSVDKQNLRYKGDTYLVKKNATIVAERAIAVARIQYGGNWNPEPGGWKRLANVMHNTQKMTVNVTPVTLGESKLTITDFQAAHLTGSTEFKFTPAQRDELKAFVEAGGTLIVDALGGDGRFIAAAQTELKAIFGSEVDKDLRETEALKLTDEVYTVAASPITEVEYRVFATKRINDNLRKPRVNGIKTGERIGVFMSREDISSGLVGQPVDGIYGYSPKSATELMTNMLLYAAAHAPPPPPDPKKDPPATQPVARK